MKEYYQKYYNNILVNRSTETDIDNYGTRGILCYYCNVMNGPRKSYLFNVFILYIHNMCERYFKIVYAREKHNIRKEYQK